MSTFSIQDGQLIKHGVWVGDVIKDTETGQRYKVTKINPKNLKTINPAGQIWNIPRTHSKFVKDPDQTWDGPKEKTEYELYLERVEAGITLGTAVEFDSARLRKYTGTYVCIAMPNDGTLRLAKLGGDSGRYLKGIRPDECKVVTV